jgi:hypothetical protein
MTAYVEEYRKTGSCDKKTGTNRNHSDNLDLQTVPCSDKFSNRGEYA